MTLVWLALDGVGHPLDAPAGSPWEQPLPTLRPVLDAGLALDAALGVPGLPQSGTGQSCWLTGRNAVALMGEHFGPQPGPTLQRLLQEDSLPVRLARAGGRAALLNFYVPEYLAAPADPRQSRNRMGCFPYSFRAAGLPLNPPGLPLVRASLGLDYQEPWRAVQSLAEIQALGQSVGKAAQDWDLLVVDLWFSDVLGHLGREVTPPDLQEAAWAYLRRVDALLLGLQGSDCRVVITSDHGNFENLQVKSHTTARVPFAGVGVELGRPSDIVEGGKVVAGLV